MSLFNSNDARCNGTTTAKQGFYNLLLFEQHAKLQVLQSWAISSTNLAPLHLRSLSLFRQSQPPPVPWAAPLPSHASQESSGRTLWQVVLAVRCATLPRSPLLQAQARVRAPRRHAAIDARFIVSAATQKNVHHIGIGTRQLQRVRFTLLGGRNVASRAPPQQHITSTLEYRREGGGEFRPNRKNDITKCAGGNHDASAVAHTHSSRTGKQTNEDAQLAAQLQNFAAHCIPQRKAIFQVPITQRTKYFKYFSATNRSLQNLTYAGIHKLKTLTAKTRHTTPWEVIIQCV